ncbi:uncharacterized protein LOC121833165 [Ixodes scapularis]|uniref:uncharacterized protein LOC121833165 n=1 Tax=Ixodes scapularis TaxID=6945 RepID=UPI001C38200E|nr:uncharacterized protein LOC121833165 [Ixodes scapularis]
METIPPPPKFENASNAAEQWRTFKQAFTLYLKATDAAGASSERQLALLLTDGKASSLFATLIVNERKVNFQVDNGAVVSVINHKSVTHRPIEQTSTTLRMWNGTKVIPSGKARLKVTTANGQKHVVDFIVVRNNLTPFIGRKSAERVGLITVDYNLVASIGKVNSRDHITKRYPDVFGTFVGSLPGPVHLVTKPAACSKAVTSCRIPVNIKPQLETTIRRLEQTEIIKSVTEPIYMVVWLRPP